MPAKVSCSFYPLMRPSLYFFFPPMQCWSFSGNLDFRKSSLACRWPPTSVFCRSSQAAATRGWNQLTVSRRCHSWCPTLSAYHLTHQWVRVLLGPVVYGAWFHKSHRGTSAYGWMPNFCWRGEQTKSTISSKKTQQQKILNLFKYLEST